MKCEYRNNGTTGIIETHDSTGYISFSEDISGEGFEITVHAPDEDTNRLFLTSEELEAFAQIAVLVYAANPELLRYDVDGYRHQHTQRQRDFYDSAAERAFGPLMPFDLESAYDEAHRPLTDIYGDALSGGGDGTPSEYAVEGWGIQKLDNNDFEVTYKV